LVALYWRGYDRFLHLYTVTNFLRKTMLKLRVLSCSSRQHPFPPFHTVKETLLNSYIEQATFRKLFTTEDRTHFCPSTLLQTPWGKNLLILRVLSCSRQHPFLPLYTVKETLLNSYIEQATLRYLSTAADRTHFCLSTLLETP
jgi:hypothetical protein